MKFYADEEELRARVLREIDLISSCPCDEDLVLMAFDYELERVKNYTNQDYLPHGLYQFFKQCVLGRYLLNLASFKADLLDDGENLAGVKSLVEGDLSITFAEEDSFKDRVLQWANFYTSYEVRSEWIRFRKLEW